MSNKMYDFLKWVALVALDACGALYFGLSQIWGLPYGSEITGTVTIVGTFLGTLLGISTIQYKRSLNSYSAEEEDGDG